MRPAEYVFEKLAINKTEIAAKILEKYKNPVTYK